jgi:hypothetical protein
MPTWNHTTENIGHVEPDMIITNISTWEFVHKERYTTKSAIS